MPTYEYRCKNCSTIHEIKQGFNDERPTKCPRCAGELVRVFHPVGVVFKGSGFHRTDYSVKTASGEAQTKTSQAQPSESKTADSSKPAAEPTSKEPKDTKK
jgi:putative FmdB family regulatory protein